MLNIIQNLRIERHACLVYSEYLFIFLYAVLGAPLVLHEIMHAYDNNLEICNLCFVKRDLSSWCVTGFTCFKIM